MGKVDLKVALNPDVPFYLLILAPREWVFYLPAFLSFFYDLENSDTDLFEVFLNTICGKNSSVKYDDFHELTTEQSKLVAFFILTVANFSYKSASNLARQALNDYWGKYLF